jgi:hypothetical protein
VRRWEGHRLAALEIERDDLDPRMVAEVGDGFDVAVERDHVVAASGEPSRVTTSAAGDVGDGTIGSDGTAEALHPG